MSSKNDDAVPKMIPFPRDLHERTRVVAKRLKTTSAQLIRDALREKVEALEDKFRLEEARAAAEKKARKEERTFRSLADRKPGLALTSSLPSDAESVRDDGHLADVYEREAKRLLEVLKDPFALRLRLDEAILTVKSYAPLTYPPDEQIVKSLERALTKLREAAPPATTPVTERVIDPNRVQSFGDVIGDVIEDLTTNERTRT